MNCRTKKQREKGVKNFYLSYRGTRYDKILLSEKFIGMRFLPESNSEQALLPNDKTFYGNITRKQTPTRMLVMQFIFGELHRC